MRKLQTLICAILLTVVTILVYSNYTGKTSNGTDISIASESSVAQAHREKNNHLSELFPEQQHEDRQTDPARITYAEADPARITYAEADPARITYTEAAVTSTTSPTEGGEVLVQGPVCYSVEAFKAENARRVQHMRDNCKREHSHLDVYPHILDNINEWFHFRNEHLAWLDFRFPQFHGF